jgi:hypothetical protein
MFLPNKPNRNRISADVWTLMFCGVPPPTSTNEIFIVAVNSLLEDIMLNLKNVNFSLRKLMKV